MPLPDLLSTRPRPPDPTPDSHDGIHDFDLDLQFAPSCPDFRGIHVFVDFFSVDEANQLLREIGETPFSPAQSGKMKQHHGPKINFNKQKINTSQFRGLPDYVRRIESRLHDIAERDRPGRPADILALRKALEVFEATDAFVLRYLERDASNLDFHRDDLFAYGEAILDVSLESDSVLTFLECQDLEYREPDTQTRPAKCVRVPLPARSLAVVYGRARFAWDHAILAYDITGRRTSITLRTLNDTLHESEAGKRILDIARGKAIPT